MPAFGGENMMPVTVPVEAALAESGAGGDDALIAGTLGGNVIQWNQIVRRESGDSPARGFKVVNQSCVLKMKFLGQAAGFDSPRKVGSLNPAVSDGAGDAETSLRRANAGHCGFSRNRRGG